MNSWPITIGTLMVFCDQASQFQMWMSVPQMLALRTLISTSLGPISGHRHVLHPDARLGLGLDQSSHPDHPQRATDLGEGGDGAVELLASVRGGHLRADARLALRHHRVAEADDVDPLGQHLVGECRGELRVAEHHRDDGVVRPGELEAQLRHLARGSARRWPGAAGASSSPPSSRSSTVSGRRADRRRQRVGEQVRPRRCRSQLDDLLPPGGVAAGRAAERLAQRAGEDVDAAHARRSTRACPCPFAPDEPHRVRVVHHHQRPVPVGEVADGGEVGDDAVHREHAVGGDEPVAGAARPRSSRASSSRHVVVARSGAAWPCRAGCRR